MRRRVFSILVGVSLSIAAVGLWAASYGVDAVAGYASAADAEGMHDKVWVWFGGGGIEVEWYRSPITPPAAWRLGLAPRYAAGGSRDGMWYNRGRNRGFGWMHMRVSLGFVALLGCVWPVWQVAQARFRFTEPLTVLKRAYAVVIALGLLAAVTPAWFVAGVVVLAGVLKGLGPGVDWMMCRLSPEGRAHARARAGLCPDCGYDLRAHAPGQRCPECGAVVATDVARKEIA